MAGLSSLGRVSGSSTEALGHPVPVRANLDDISYCRRGEKTRDEIAEVLGGISEPLTLDALEAVHVAAELGLEQRRVAL